MKQIKNFSSIEDLNKFLIENSDNIKNFNTDINVVKDYYKVEFEYKESENVEH